MTTKRDAFKVIKLIAVSPRSHTELMHLRKQYDCRLRSTLRDLQAEKIITPCGNRVGESGRPQLLFGLCL